MSQLTLSDLSKEMRDIDFAMLLTRTEDGQIAGRPMSNNQDVEYDGDSYYFTFEASRTVKDIMRDPTIGLAFQGSKGLLAAAPLFISVEAQAELIRDKAVFAEHWTKELDRWFENGVDTPGVVLIKAHATRIHYWDGKNDGELKL